MAEHSDVVFVSDEKYEKKYGKKISYYLDERLKKNLDTKVIPDLGKRDKDIVLLIDGHEGSGKSTLGLQIGKYIDPTLTINRIVFSAEDFRDAVLKAKKGQVIVYDEAFTGLSARSSLSGVNKVLVSLMMQMRQKNLCVIIILPTLFLLDKYVGIFRSKALIHVYETGGNRGYFRIYNQKRKKLLYLFGSKTYNYAPKIGKKKLFTRFKGRFYGVFALGDEKEEDLYRSKKMKALEETERNPMTSATVKYREQRDVLIYLLRKELKIKTEDFASILSDYNFDISGRQVRTIVSRFGDKVVEDPVDVDKKTKKSKKPRIKAVKLDILEDERLKREKNEENLEDIDESDLNDEELPNLERIDDENDLKEPESEDLDLKSDDIDESDEL